jgi:peptide/nickel transport system permease protein
MALTEPIARAPTIARRRRGAVMPLLRRYLRNKPAVFGAVVLLFLVLVALGADLIAPRPVNQLSRDTLVAPNSTYLMGTDQIGRDVLSRVIYGTRVTLIVGLGAALLAILIGTAVGATAGYFGGWVDALLMRLVELFQILPNFFLALLIVALFGAGVDRVIIVIGILSWPSAARLARAQFLSLKEQNFVEAARAIGLSDRAIILGEILPNASAPLLVQGSLDVASAILVEAGLGFLGLSSPDSLTWGSMLRDAQRYLIHAWWIGIFPGCAIFLTVVAFNFVGDGLNDMLNPRLRNIQR